MYFRKRCEPAWALTPFNIERPSGKILMTFREALPPRNCHPEASSLRHDGGRGRIVAGLQSKVTEPVGVVERKFFEALQVLCCLRIIALTNQFAPVLFGRRFATYPEALVRRPAARAIEARTWDHASVAATRRGFHTPLFFSASSQTTGPTNPNVVWGARVATAIV